MRYNEILLEYRIQNIENFERWLYDKSIVLKPLKEKILKFVSRERMFHEPASIADLAPGGYDLKDFERGTLVRINMSIFDRYIGHIVDWLEDAAMQEDDECDSIHWQMRTYNNEMAKAKGSKSIEEMYAMADAYFKAKNKKLRGEEDWPGIEEIIAYEDGHKWIQLTSKKALQREGKLMDHCIASYWPRIETGHYRVYSLRDKENMPLATVSTTEIEMMYKYKSPQPAVKRPDRWIIDQIQGPGNTNVDRKYASEINDFEKYLANSERNDLVKYENDILAV